MIEIGRSNKLRILRQTSVGVYLGDESGEEVLLPNKYCPEKFELEDKIEVFVYRDHEERKVAANIKPKILLNEFELLQVTAVTNVGAFLDWGMEKELLVPFRERRQKMQEGKWYIVYLTVDRETDRLYASNIIEKYLQNEVLTVEPGEEVALLVYKKTDLGFSVIVNNKHKGLIFRNEIFKELSIGEKINGFVKNIREDNKLDISMQRIGYENFNDFNSELIFHKLGENEGFLPVTDKSSPEEIYKQFGMSKKAFKKSIGALYKQRKITIHPEGIKSIKE
ncbi:MAG: S1-like domain-containing RNA-binding protein [Candidatus Aminicenantes bacterium]|nr:S1-like domain-containing RNA-binding protein [Candidatus Aminicenantes bacterium]